MLSKKRNFMSPNPNQNTYPVNPYQAQASPFQYDISRLETEINENKRQISEMLKRISRLENFLGIRNDSTYDSDCRY